MNNAPELGRRSNQSLAVFPDAVLALLIDLSNVTLSQGAICFDAGDLIKSVYFPASGLISLIVCTRGGEFVEAGMIGREGAAGLQNAMGQRPSLTRAIVQAPGIFWSISAEPLRHAIENSEQAKAVVNGYTEILWTEAQQLAACNAVHQSLPRLARWLLQSADRTAKADRPLPHAYAHARAREKSLRKFRGQVQSGGPLRGFAARGSVPDWATCKLRARCRVYWGCHYTPLPPPPKERTRNAPTGRTGHLKRPGAAPPPSDGFFGRGCPASSPRRHPA